MLCYNIHMKINKCCNKNDQRTLNILKKNNKGLTAYGVLSELQKHKNIKPMTVYRSLKNLQEIGVVHKSNHNKTFFVCKSDKKDKHNPSIAICKSCGDTEELKSEIFETVFKKNPIKKYDLSKFQIEVSAICKRCN